MTECSYTMRDFPDYLREFYYRRNEYIHRERPGSYAYFLDEIPFRIKRRMCTCLDSQKIKGANHIIIDSVRKLTYCGTCEKLLWHYVHICCNCRLVFLKDFKHTASCWWQPLCWQCIQEVSETVCQHTPNDRIILEPQVLKDRPVEKFEFEIPSFSLD